MTQADNRARVPVQPGQPENKPRVDGGPAGANPDVGQTFTTQPGPDTGDTHPDALTDAVTPQTDDDLNSALEDTFPASDPINFAGGVTGIPADRDITPPPSTSPPVGTHPLAGGEGAPADLEDAARESFGADEGLDKQVTRNEDQESR